MKPNITIPRLGLTIDVIPEIITTKLEIMNMINVDRIQIVLPLTPSDLFPKCGYQNSCKCEYVM